MKKFQINPVRHPTRNLALLFLVLIGIGAVILRLPVSGGQGPVSWSTALFTATSAVCVNGLVVVDTSTAYSTFGQAIILVLFQLGALGYMLSSTLIFVFLRRETGLHDRILLRDTLGLVTLRDTWRLVLRAVLFTFCVELAGAVILAARFVTEPDYTFGQALWMGLFHSVSAFCNAGFDLFGVDANGSHSLGRFREDVTVNLTVAFLIITGGLGFVVCEELRRYKRFKPLSLHARIVLTMSFWLTAMGAFAILITEWTNPATLAPLSLPGKFLASFFQSVTLRSAGLSTLDFGQMRSITLMAACLLMFVGASPGGTGGGVKTTTAAAVLVAVKASLLGRPDAEIWNRRLPLDVIYRAIMLLCLSFFIITAALFILTFTEPTALREAGIRDNIFMRIQFEALSAFGTTGASTGITSALSETGRSVIMVLMFLGRLGPTMVVSVIAASAGSVRRRLPEEKITLG